jgi:hypothetical protein
MAREFGEAREKLCDCYGREGTRGIFALAFITSLSKEKSLEYHSILGTEGEVYGDTLLPNVFPLPYYLVITESSCCPRFHGTWFLCELILLIKKNHVSPLLQPYPLRLAPSSYPEG